MFDILMGGSQYLSSFINCIPDFSSNGSVPIYGSASSGYSSSGFATENTILRIVNSRPVEAVSNLVIIELIFNTFPSKTDWLGFVFLRLGSYF